MAALQDKVALVTGASSGLGAETGTLDGWAKHSPTWNGVHTRRWTLLRHRRAEAQSSSAFASWVG